MSAMEEHRVIKDPKGGHNLDKVLLGEIVFFLFDVIDHIFLRQDVLDPLKLSEVSLSMSHREEVLQNKAPLSPVVEFDFQSTDRTPERIAVQRQERFSLSGYRKCCLL